MFPNHFSLEQHMNAYVAEHRASAGELRLGQPSWVLGPVAVLMGGFARLANTVERWARGEAAAPSAQATQALPPASHTRPALR